MCTPGFLDLLLLRSVPPLSALCIKNYSRTTAIRVLTKMPAITPSWYRMVPELTVTVPFVVCDTVGFALCDGPVVLVG